MERAEKRQGERDMKKVDALKKIEIPKEASPEALKKMIDDNTTMLDMAQSGMQMMGATSDLDDFLNNFLDYWRTMAENTDIIREYQEGLSTQNKFLTKLLLDLQSKFQTVVDRLDKTEKSLKELTNAQRNG